MKDRKTIQFRSFEAETEEVKVGEIAGVMCTKIAAVSVEDSGFRESGRLLVWIPEQHMEELSCGDQVCVLGTDAWFTVTEIQDNRKRGSSLSHFKVTAKR